MRPTKHFDLEQGVEKYVTLYDKLVGAEAPY
jgi:hypothetical protein